MFISIKSIISREIPGYLTLPINFIRLQPNPFDNREKYDTHCLKEHTPGNLNKRDVFLKELFWNYEAWI